MSSDRAQCQCLTQAGRQCLLPDQQGSTKCHIHKNNCNPVSGQQSPERPPSPPRSPKREEKTSKKIDRKKYGMIDPEDIDYSKIVIQKGTFQAKEKVTVKVKVKPSLIIPDQVYVTRNADKAYSAFLNQPEKYNHSVVLIRTDKDGNIVSTIKVIENTNYGIYYTAKEEVFSGKGALPKPWQSKGEPEGIDDSEQVLDLLEKLMKKNGYVTVLWEDDKGNPQVISLAAEWKSAKPNLIFI